MTSQLEWKLLKEESYGQFFKEARDFSCTSFEYYTEEKKRLLIKYWPRRFGPGGKQDLKARSYSNMQIGALFKHMLEYSSKYVK